MRNGYTVCYLDITLHLRSISVASRLLLLACRQGLHPHGGLGLGGMVCVVHFVLDYSDEIIRLLMTDIGCRRGGFFALFWRCGWGLMWLCGFLSLDGACPVAGVSSARRI